MPWELVPVHCFTVFATAAVIRIRYNYKVCSGTYARPMSCIAKSSVFSAPFSSVTNADSLV